MIDEVFGEATKALTFGKYTQWVERLSADAFDRVLRAVGVFGTAYNSARNSTGTKPIQECDAHDMSERRMCWGLEAIAKVQAGESLEEEAWYVRDLERSSDPGPVFTQAFRERLRESDLLIWAVDLDFRRLWILLSGLGEYGVRASALFERSKRIGYPPPTFNVAPQTKDVIGRALLVLVAAFGWKPAVNVCQVWTQLFGDAP